MLDLLLSCIVAGQHFSIHCLDHVLTTILNLITLIVLARLAISATWCRNIWLKLEHQTDNVVTGNNDLEKAASRYNSIMNDYREKNETCQTNLQNISLMVCLSMDPLPPQVFP